ncbi:Hypothetical_protein [Hexamita inflata]|uniref:Hypothetical_protein n=1 Tax=Hexamita inflata TaxID=28002 RepID=A0ABP1HRQ2_9EUKA
MFQVLIDQEIKLLPYKFKKLHQLINNTNPSQIDIRQKLKSVLGTDLTNPLSSYHFDQIKEELKNIEDITSVFDDLFQFYEYQLQFYKDFENVLNCESQQQTSQQQSNKPEIDELEICELQNANNAQKLLNSNLYSQISSEKDEIKSQFYEKKDAIKRIQLHYSNIFNQVHLDPSQLLLLRDHVELKTNCSYSSAINIPDSQFTVLKSQTEPKKTHKFNNHYKSVVRSFVRK